jgi:hypothetical protein
LLLYSKISGDALLKAYISYTVTIQRLEKIIDASGRWGVLFGAFQ